MAIAVDVAKDPKAIKSKFIGNFTKRQVICFGAAAVVGVPFYLLTRNILQHCILWQYTIISQKLQLS